MKKYIWIFLLLCSSRVGAQDYFDSSVHYLTIGHNTAEDPELYWHSYYHMVLDSVYNDTQYYSMMGNGIEPFYYYQFKVIGKRVYQGTGKNYLKNYLLYDFSLKEGDTAWVNGGPTSWLSLLTVDSIRTIQLGPFTYVAHHVTAGWLQFPFVFIEHIGSLENGVLFYDYHAFEHSSALITLCKSDTLMLWRDHVVIKSGQNTCHPVFYKSSIEQNTLDRKAFAYPNPSNGVIQISSIYADEELVLEIYNMSGQKMLEAMKVMAGQEIDLQYLPKGLYCVHLLTAYGTIQQVLSME